MVPLSTLFSIILLLLSLNTSAEAETVEHAGTAFHIYRVGEDENVELHLAEKNGEPNTFPKLETRLKTQGRRLKFAINSGIFEGNFLPSGLHIAEGKTITRLNLDDFVKRSEGEFTPNFFLKPNGVFIIRPDRTAAIFESHHYATLEEQPILATQSGPLLVRDGTIHPILTADSTSRRYRNGVGIGKNGEIIFVCSVLDRELGMSNLYHFAELFRDRLDCRNALYLDGDISYVYIRNETGPIRETNWFAGIIAITEPVP